MHIMLKTAGYFLSMSLFLFVGCAQGGKVTQKSPAIEGDVHTADWTDWTEPLDSTEGDLTDMDAGDIPFDFTPLDLPDVDVPEVDVVIGNCEEAPFDFGCPCQENGDCESGFCVEGPDGFVCTETCLEECPEGWQCKGVTGYGADIVFLCVPETKKLCYSCQADSQCSGGYCLPIGDSEYCTYECGEEETCPSAYSCVEVERMGQIVNVCVPDSGTCECTTGSAGQTRPCSVVNQWGACTGEEICDAELGFVECTALTPEVEICDGKDNDCDGLFDEELPESKECEITVADVGTCYGQATCVGPLGWVCDALTPDLETCDFKDNDCDNEIDEDFRVNGKYVDQNNCGTCGQNCDGIIPNASAVCDGGLNTPLCVVEECDSGFYKLNEFQCLPEGQNICRPCVNDIQCEGGICNEFFFGQHCTEACTTADDCPEFFECEALDGFDGTWCVPVNDTCDCGAGNAGTTRPCSIDNDIGTCVGIETCEPAVGWVGCTASEAFEEICDGLDNDCNGIPDDNLPLSQPCENSNDFGVCLGEESCLGSQGWVCNAQTPEDELCDYQDNNCDGQVDETFIVDGKYATQNHCGSCNKDCAGALPNAETFCYADSAVPECRVSSCLPGFYQLNDYQCILPPDVQCFPCESDADCYFEHCVFLDDGNYCLEACGDEGGCPEGTHCDNLGAFGDICVPDTNSCGCNEDNAGKVRSCSIENEFGTCYGVETCDAFEGWLPCAAQEPEAEICNGLDDDCDGLIDEEFQNLGVCQNENEFGSCEGFSVCTGTQGIVCQGPEPEAETCDYQDNNCDGQVDEDFLNADGKYSTLNHCGSCSKDCEGALPNATAYCDDTDVVPLCKVESCGEGFYQLNEFHCIDPPDTTCQECESDADCYFDRCVPLDGGKYCLSPCEDSLCSAGTNCTGVTGYGDVCVPSTATCNCTPANDGAVRSCVNSNTFGTCYGFQTCDAQSGWSQCDALIPAEEECDAIDNDCDGFINEGYSNLGACEISNGFGSCTGVYVCQGEGGLVCEGQEPTEEICDYIDNNCNGLVDEDFKDAQGSYDQYEHCGSCSTSCENALPHATAYCDASGTLPECKVAGCNAGYYKLNDYQCILPPDTQCQACDSDSDCYFNVCVPLDDGSYCLPECDAGTCDAGAHCESISGVGDVCVPDTDSCSCTPAGDGSTRSCTVSNAAGTCYGTETCDALLGWTGCTAKTPADETCNGQDDNCNGQVDEGFDNLGACEITNTFGSCPGTLTCAGASGEVCVAQVPAAETCDYQDNNCNGAVDEDFKNVDGKYSTNNHCGSCNNPCADAIANATGICDSSYTIPRCVVDSCDSGYYELSPFQCVIPPDPSCQECADDGDCYGESCITIDGESRCAPACNIDADCVNSDYECVSNQCIPKSGSCDCLTATAGLQRSCDNTNSWGTCYGSQTCDPTAGWSACSANVPAEEICNGQDDDCDNETDEGFTGLGACDITNAFGTCEGSLVCTGPGGLVCQGQTPSVETCDYQDNDCNGAVDEDFKTGTKYTDFYHCGTCSTSCESGFPNATAMCDGTRETPVCVVESCDSGYFKFNDFQCIPDSASLCEPCVTDDNCVLEGAMCVTLSDGTYCSKHCDTSADCPSGYGCQPYGGDTQCIPDTNSCLCTAGNTGLTRSCEATWPVAPAPEEPYITCYGLQSCGVSGWGSCDLDEEVCDGQDNNCDGTVDEGFLFGGKYTTDANCGQCGNNCTFLSYNNAQGVCNSALSVPACEMECTTNFFDVNLNPADGCECEYVSVTDNPDGIDQNCDGVDGEVLNAIFVAKNGSDGNSGTIEAPMLTIEAAMAKAETSGLRDVYVATGVYSQSIALVEGIRVYGGYSSDFLQRNIVLYETVIFGQAFSSAKPGAVSAVNITGAAGSTVFDGFSIFGRNNIAAGGSSYAVYIRNCDDALVFSNNTVQSGAGGSGTNGNDGVSGGSGVGGVAGESAFGDSSQNCSNLAYPIPRSGGAGAVHSCSFGSAVSGGNGGGNTCPDDYDEGPVSYENGQSGSGTGAGSGGAGGWDRDIWVCFFGAFECRQASGSEVGSSGGEGTEGTSGETPGGNGCTSGMSDGQVSAGLWTGSTGSSGLDATNGSGGGGGGAGGGAQGCSAQGTHMGGTGGGGGSGGCAGTGGTGGSSGGGAFGLFLVWDTTPSSIPSIVDNVVYGGIGGAGGDGGNGGSGGPGGSGGLGGESDPSGAKCAAPGGDGGDGGNGGHGEGGGGGCGGASFSIFAAGQGTVSLTAYQSSNTLVAGSGGAGGSGGPSIGNAGDNGSNGASGVTNF